MVASVARNRALKERIELTGMMINSFFMSYLPSSFYTYYRTCPLAIAGSVPQMRTNFIFRGRRAVCRSADARCKERIHSHNAFLSR